MGTMRRIWGYLFGTTFRAGASILTVLTLGSYAMGLVRDMLFSRFLGATRLLDVYNAAFIIPDVLLNVFVAGALAAAFVPVFSHLRAQGEEAESERVATTMFVAAPGAMLIIGGAAFLAMPWLSRIVAPGFSSEELALLVRMSRFMLLSPIMFALSNTLGGVLVSLERFIGYGLSPLLYNLGIISGIFLSQKMGPLGLVIGTLAGAALHLIIRLVSVIRSHLKLRGPINLGNQNFRQILKLMIPRMAGQPIEQLTFSLFTSLASTLAVGSVAIVNFARNFQSVPVSVFAISFSTAIFASLSRKAALREHDGFLYHFYETAKPLIWVSLASTLFYVLLGTSVVHTLLGGGKFGPDDVARTGHLLALFALAIPAESLNHLLVRSFYALKDTWTPVLVTIPSLVLIYILSTTLIPMYGLNALGIAYATSQTAKGLILWLLLKRKLSFL